MHEPKLLDILLTKLTFIWWVWADNPNMASFGAINCGNSMLYQGNIRIYASI